MKERARILFPETRPIFQDKGKICPPVGHPCHRQVGVWSCADSRSDHGEQMLGLKKGSLAGIPLHGKLRMVSSVSDIRQNVQQKIKAV